MRALTLLLALPAAALAASEPRAEPRISPPPATATLIARAAAAASVAAPATGLEPPPVKPSAEPRPRAARPPAPATTLTARIDLATQRLEVSYDGRLQHTWPISSGREGFATPRGSFRPQWTARMWYSRKYDNAPMPHAVFFTGGVAVHATQSTALLGQPASHGCVRLAPANAARFYALVQKHGLKQTRIVVQGTPPAPRVARAASQGRASARGQSGLRMPPPVAWSHPSLRPQASRPPQPVVRLGPGGIVHLPAGSPYRGRTSFVHNGVTYVRIR
jgi:hypothetical protein